MMSSKRPFDPMIMTDYDVDFKCTFKGSEVLSILPNYKKHCDIRVSNVLVAVDQINVPTDESWPQHSHETRCVVQTDEYNEMGDAVIAELPNALNSYRYLVFFLNGFAKYVHVSQIRTCCGKMRIPVHLSRLPDEFEIFLSLYFTQNRLLIAVTIGSKLEFMAEQSDQWRNAIVNEVDGSMMLVSVENETPVWVFRGSHRIRMIQSLFKSKKEEIMFPLSDQQSLNESETSTDCVCIMDDPCKPTNENLLPKPRHRSELSSSRVRFDYVDTLKRLGARHRMMFPEARIKSNDHICSFKCAPLIDLIYTDGRPGVIDLLNDRRPFNPFHIPFNLRLETHDKSNRDDQKSCLRIALFSIILQNPSSFRTVGNDKVTFIDRFIYFPRKCGHRL
ncbi:hypothetical protein ACOME3_010555 [Neoechinorhynchus agilis]